MDWALAALPALTLASLLAYGNGCCIMLAVLGMLGGLVLSRSRALEEIFGRRSNTSLHGADQLVDGLLMLKATIKTAYEVCQTQTSEASTGGLMLKVMDAILDGSKPEEEDLWTLHDVLVLNNMEHAMESESLLPSSLLHELTPGLLPYDYRSVDSGPATLGDLNALTRRTDEGPATLGSDPSLPTMLVALSRADRPHAPSGVVSVDMSSRRQSLHVALSKLQGRKHCLKSVSATNLDTTGPISQSTLEPQAQVAASSLVNKKRAIMRNFLSFNSRSKVNSSLDACSSLAAPAAGRAAHGKRAASTGSRDSVEQAAVGQAGPSRSTFGAAVDRARWGARLSMDGLQGAQAVMGRRVLSSNSHPLHEELRDVESELSNSSSALMAEKAKLQERTEGRRNGSRFSNKPATAFLGDVGNNAGTLAKSYCLESMAEKGYGQDKEIGDADKTENSSVLDFRSWFKGCKPDSAKVAPPEEENPHETREYCDFSKPRAAPGLEMETALEAAYNSFSFDAFQLNAITQGHPLSTLAYFLFHESGLISSLNLHTIKLARFLQRIEAGYHPVNPYHNAVHAADVLQTLHVILHCGKLASGLADPLLLLAAYLGAVVHDYDHGGHTNDFLKNSHDKLAIRYNDLSPLENHHLAAGFEILLAPGHGCNFLYDLPLAEYTRLRNAIISLVLATDMKQHFSLLGQAKVMVQQAKLRGSVLFSSSNENATLRTSIDLEARSLSCHSPLQPVQNLIKAAPQGSCSDSGLGTQNAGGMGALLMPVCADRGPLRPSKDAATTQQPAHKSMLAGLTRKLSMADLGPAGVSAMPGQYSLKTSLTNRASAGDPGQANAAAVPGQHIFRTSLTRTSAGPSSDGSGGLCPPKLISSASSRHWDKEHGLKLAKLSPEQRLLLLQVALKSADLGHVSEDLDVHLKWVQCLEEEFFRQGDQEKAANLPSSPLFDREKPGVSKSQVGFFEVIALPLFKALAAAAPGTQPLVDGAERNYEFWKQRQARQQVKAEAEADT